MIKFVDPLSVASWFVELVFCLLLCELLVIMAWMYKPG